MRNSRQVMTWRAPARLQRFAFGAAALVLGAMACSPPASGTRVSRSTLVIGIDVSGSFVSRGRYESAIDFAANYLYAHLHALGELKQPTAVFVGTVGGEKPGETKSFQPIDTFEHMTVAQIAAYLRREYPSRDGLTDYNPFFQRVATLVKRQNLVLSPLNAVRKERQPQQVQENRREWPRVPVEKHDGAHPVSASHGSRALGEERPPAPGADLDRRRSGDGDLALALSRGHEVGESGGALEVDLGQH